MARPTKFSDARMSVIVNALRDGTTRRDAAAAAGVSKSLFYEWIAEGEKGEAPAFVDFLDALTRAEAECANRMARIITQGAADDPKFAIEWLKRRRKEEWSERSEVTGADGKDFTITIREEVASNARN